MIKEFTNLSPILDFTNQVHYRALQNYKARCLENKWGGAAWVELVESLIDYNYLVQFTEDRYTELKYIYVSQYRNGDTFTILFPSKNTNLNAISYKDAEFIVGKQPVSDEYKSWKQALSATNAYFTLK